MTSAGGPLALASALHHGQASLHFAALFGQATGGTGRTLCSLFGAAAATYWEVGVQIKSLDNSILIKALAEHW